MTACTRTRARIVEALLLDLGWPQPEAWALSRLTVYVVLRWVRFVRWMDGEV